MRLADHDIEVELGGEIIELRPTLRHAIRLARLPGSLGGLADQVTQGSLTAAVTILNDHHPHPYLATHIMDAGLDTLAGPLLSYLMACSGYDPDARFPANDGGESIPFPQFLEGLYKIGTGWIGWSADQTLNATPMEIMRAHSGRMDMLRAVFGSDEKTQKKPATPEDLNKKFRAVLGGFPVIKATAGG